MFPTLFATSGRLLFVAAMAFLFSLVAAGAASAQVTPPCPNPYGTPGDQSAIEQAMYSGTATQVTNAINTAKNHRGNQVGCPEQTAAVSIYPSTPPTLAAIQAAWNTNHAPGIAAYAIPACPKIGRQDAGRALGAYYARLAAGTASLPKLKLMGDSFIAQQYTSANSSAAPPPNASRGVIGYINAPSADSCYLGPDLGAAVQTFCTNTPSICITYNGGGYSGRKFLVADIIPAQNVYDGGIAYDHGFAGVMFVEASLQQTSAADRTAAGNAALAAANWAIAEKPVRNHNYTAKLVWVLAEVYGLTGTGSYKTALMDKINRNLKPGLLRDTNSDGNVDGMSPAQPFSGLTNVAKVKGRYWDGHNSVPGYQAMNAWALVEAYVALRDRGQPEASQIKPLAFEALDNLAREVNTIGTAAGPSLKEMPIPFLLALWKIEEYEPGEAGNHQNWKDAAARLWNMGFATQPYGDNTINVGLYLLYASAAPYVPLGSR